MIEPKKGRTSPTGHRVAQPHCALVKSVSQQFEVDGSTMRMWRHGDSVARQRAFWDRAARRKPAWFTAACYTTLDENFASDGDQEIDKLFGDLDLPKSGGVVLEIGCGPGRMTRRLAELFETVHAIDISAAMLDRARVRLQESHPNIRFMLVKGDGCLPFAEGTFDLVFSYITLQHIPDRAVQVRYIQESIRTLKPGGLAAIQIRSPSAVAHLYRLGASVNHLFQQKVTFHAAWLGTSIDTEPLVNACKLNGLEVRLQRTHVQHVWVILGKPSARATVGDLRPENDGFHRQQLIRVVHQPPNDPRAIQLPSEGV